MVFFDRLDSVGLVVSVLGEIFVVWFFKGGCVKRVEVNVNWEINWEGRVGVGG